MALLHAWLIAFLVTVLSELAVAVPLLAAGGSLARRIAGVVLGQLATHPAVWFIWPLFGFSRTGYLLAAEAFALIVEALVYRFVFERISWSRAIAASALANGTSMFFGLWLH